MVPLADELLRGRRRDLLRLRHRLWRAAADEHLRSRHHRHFGQGPVGLAGTQFAKAMGARVIALDVNPQRLAARKEFGADEVVDPGSNDPVAAIKDLTHGRYADLSLDTS